VSEWQPISTTPRDSTLILTATARGPMIAYWGRRGEANSPGWLGGHCHIYHIDQPTHWQPLPEPPEETP
jgi:hypothetical protein